MKKGMFSLIIPAHRLFKREDGRYELEACIDSILDQDYTNYEIIVVANGPEKNVIHSFVVEKYKNRLGKGLKVFTIDPANAAIARNEGAKIAEGEFRSYFSSDLEMYPGTLRTWHDAFKANPEVSIVYSDIDYMTAGVPEEQRGYVGEYDRYAHECYNLIDGAYPVRAEYDVSWGEDIESLQDWYWSLGVTEKAPAIKIPEVGYRSELPKEGGLSDHFSKNWAKMQKKIKKARNIPTRDIVVTSLSAPYHALKTAKLLGYDYLPAPQLWSKPHSYKAIYLLGYFTSNVAGHNAVFAQADPNCVRIIHWIGTDIIQMMGQTWEANYNIKEALNQFMDIQLAECEHTMKECSAMGLKVQELPLPLDTSKYDFIKTKPKDFTVAVYAPGLEELHIKKYHLDSMINIAKNLPDIKFVFFGLPENQLDTDMQTDNITLKPWTPIREIAKESNVLLRFTVHDGLPMGPAEFMLHGRSVISSAPIPGVVFTGLGNVDGPTLEQRKNEIITHIRNLQKKDISIKKRKEIRKKWKEILDADVVKAKLERMIKKRQAYIKEQVKKAKTYIEKNYGDKKKGEQ